MSILPKKRLNEEMKRGNNIEVKNIANEAVCCVINLAEIFPNVFSIL